MTLFRRLGVLCGIVSPVLWLGLIAAGDTYRPDISAVTDFISELGERGSSTEVLLRYGGFIVTGGLYLCFACVLPAVSSPRWRGLLVAAFVALDGAGRMGAGVYPCDPGCDGLSRDQELHGLFARVGFSSGILAAVAAGLLYRRWLDGLLGLAAAFFLVLMMRANSPTDAAGLWERLATGALSIWLLMFAARILRASDGEMVS